MAKKTCKNGHVYDASIYGQSCPFCPKEDDEKTRISVNMGSADIPTGEETRLSGSIRFSESTRRSVMTENANDNEPQKTRLRILGDDSAPQDDSNGGRLLVGLLVTYNAQKPCGEVFKIFEGKTLIGRNHSCDISCPNDEFMSGEHFKIQYLQATGRFVAEDCMSTGGTFVNGKPYDSVDKIVLKNGDIIVLGHTKFVFLEIPPMFLASGNENEK